MAHRLYRINVVAKAVGLSEPLLRAWERRYGLLEPQRTAGGYRAYTDVDIEVLRRVKALTEQGISIGEVAALVPQLRREVKREEAQPAPSPVATDQLSRWKAEIHAAADEVDQARLELVLDEALAVLPPLVVFERLIAPVEVEVGERWHRGELTVAQEHLVTQAVRNRLVSALVARPRSGARHVICACLPEEDHDLGLLGAALRFQAAGLQVTYLGARTPSEHLGRAVEKSRSQLVALSAHLDQGARAFRAALAQARKHLPPSTVVVIGGAAARRYAAVVDELGARLVETPEQWQQLLRTG